MQSLPIKAEAKSMSEKGADGLSPTALAFLIILGLSIGHLGTQAIYALVDAKYDRVAENIQAKHPTLLAGYEAGQ